MTGAISPLSVVAPGTELGPGATVEEFCLIGRPDESGPGRPTRIGPGARLRSHTVIYAGNDIGRGFQTGHHVLIRADNVIGDDVSVGSSSVVEHHVQIADGVRIHSQCFIPEWTVLEEGAWLGPRVTLTNAPFPRCPEVARCLRGVIVEAGARVGANVTILPGVRIGAGALIGAGAVVTRDVPARSVVVGAAGRVVKSVDDLLCPVGAAHQPYPSPDQESTRP